MRKTQKAPRKPALHIALERAHAASVSRALWRGLLEFNRAQAGPLNYSRKIISVRDSRRHLLGGLILESYWRESYIELLWLTARARRAGYGSRLIEAAEREARKRGSRLIHLNTFSFQAPRFYEKLGYRQFGKMSGSPQGASRYFYVKRLTVKTRAR